MTEKTEEKKGKIKVLLKKTARETVLFLHYKVIHRYSVDVFSQFATLAL